jgi:hypothetical protein
MPAPQDAVEDLPTSYSAGCLDNEADPPTPCVSGDADGSVRLVAVGDSMMQQWEPALDLLGRERGVRVELYSMSQCPFTLAVPLKNGEPFERCRQWSGEVLDALLADPPDLVLTSQGEWRAVPNPGDPASVASAEAMQAGLHSLWTALDRAGITIGVLLKNPKWADETQVYECVARNRDHLTACARTPDTTIADMQRAAVASSATRVHVVDLNPYVCSASTCPAVIGNVLVYRQGTHLTRTYVETLAPRLEAALEPLLPGGRT